VKLKRGQAGASRLHSPHAPPSGSWCPGPELNRYVSFETRDFKSRASASFATRAGWEGSKQIYQFVSLPKTLHSFRP